METIFTKKKFGKYLLLFDTKHDLVIVKLFAAILLLLTFGILNTYAQAPNISYSSPQTYSVGTAISPLSPTNTGGAVPLPAAANLPGVYQKPLGVAVDVNGNVYIADFTNNAVKELPFGASSTITIGSGFSSPTGVAVDAAGNVYVADNGNHVIKKIPAGNGTVVTVAAGFSSIYGIAVGGNGFLYVTDTTTNQAIKVPVAGGTQQVIGTGFKAPSGIAVDGSGNVFITDRGNNAIKKILASNGSTVTLSTASGAPNGVAVDAFGNVYFVDNNSTVVTEIPVRPGDTTRLTTSGLLSPASITVDNHAHAFIGDSGGHILQEVTLEGYAISPGLPFGLVFKGATGVISGSPEVAAAAANYKVTATNGSGSSNFTINITVNALAPPSVSYSSPQTYTIGKAITPLSPNNSGGPINATIPVALPGSYKPFGIAVDASGNIYFTQGNNVFEILASNGSVITLGSGFLGLRSIVVDSSGNIYVSDAGNHAIKKIAAGTGAVTTVMSNINGLYGIAMDGNGKLYGTSAGSVITVPLTGGTSTIIATGFTTNIVLAADAAGVVYVADATGTIKKIPKQGESFQIFQTAATPTGIAVDAAGNLYVAGNASSIDVISGLTGNNYSIGPGLTKPFCVAVDSHNHLFIGDNGSTQIKRLDLVGYTFNQPLPPGLSFDNTTGILSGAPFNVMAAKNFTVTATNAAGSNTATINLTVNAIPAPAISYSSPHTYVVNNAITPLNPVNTGGAVIAQAPASMGQFYNPGGIAADASGNVYVAEVGITQQVGVTQITEIAGDGSGRKAVVTSVKLPQGIAVDPSGNIYIADNNNKTIDKVAPGSNTLVPIATGLGNPYGVALEGLNYLLLTDVTNHQVKRIPVNGGAAQLVGTGFSAPMGVAVDGAGNVYVADRGTNSVKEVLVSNGSTITLATGNGNLTGVAVDAAGDVFFTDSAVEELPVGGGPVITIGPGTGNIAIYKGHIFVSRVQQGNTSVEDILLSEYTISPALPAGLSINNATGVISGTPTAASPATNYAITATNPGGRSTKTVNISVIVGSSNADLSGLTSSVTPLTPSFSPGTTNYTASAPNSTTSVTVTPVASDANATITVNGTAVASGSSSPPIALTAAASTDVNVVVTAQNNTTRKSYTISVFRAGSANNNLSSMGPSVPFTPTFIPANTSYTASVPYRTTSMTVKPVTSDATATITVNGTTLASGSTSPPIALASGATTNVNIAVTAQNGTVKTYTIAVTRAPSTNDSLSSLGSSLQPIKPQFTPANTSYTLKVFQQDSMTVAPVVSDPNATLKVNGTTVASGTPTKIYMPVGDTTVINIKVTAQDGTTSKTYTISVTNPPTSNSHLNPSVTPLSPTFISVTKPTETPALAEDGIVIHEAISPNGDGINDFLQIENINQYPDNKLTIMNRSGQMIYEAKNYDNSTKAFDGHSNKNGQMQLPGTYFYQLEYTVKGVLKHKTGFIVLKY